MDFFSAPLADQEVRHSFAAVLALAFSAAPVGVFLMLRRMSLVGDAMAHAILPGVAIGFLLAGMSVFAMTAGGLVAGVTIALLSGAVSRATELQEDASLAVFLLVSLALGVVIVTANGMNIEELMEFLFGETAAKMNADKLIVIAANGMLSLVAIALIYRPLVLDCVDPVFLRTVSRSGGIAHLVFLALLVINLISAFHAFGTLLGVGIIIIPGGHRAVLDPRHQQARCACHIGSPHCRLGRAAAVISRGNSSRTGRHPGGWLSVCIVAGVRDDRWSDLAGIAGQASRGLTPVVDLHHSAENGA